MVGSQPDHDARIQDVLSWKRSKHTWRLGSGGVDNELDRRFIPKSTLEKAFKEPGKVEGLLEALFGNGSDPLPDADYIRNRYLRPFVILLCIGQGHMIYHFVEHESLQDRHLPFRAEPEGFPSSTTCDLWASFNEKQWCFCATLLEYNMSFHLGKDEILPIIHKERLGEGGSAVTHKITVHEDYDSLDPPGSYGSVSNDDHHVFVVKTYRTADAKTYYETERNAFKNLKKAGRPPPNIIGFYGSFVRGENFNIILEYADLGSLEDFMRRVQPPSSIEDTILFWDNFFNVTHGLVTIHNTKEGNPKEPQILLGWHHDVKPANILVKRRSPTSPYDCHFKLADLGLSHFKKYSGSKQSATDRDAFGTHAYGAPETCRSENALEDCDLEVKQEVDIWSMGCVYSEVTTWVGHGWNKVVEYRRRRRTEFKERICKDGECFHDGRNVLDTVKQIHSETLTNRRVNDHVTPSVLEGLVRQMMIVEGSRLTAKFVFEESKRIIQDAKTKLAETTHNMVQHDKGHPRSQTGHSPPLMPPNLPPDFRPGLAFQSTPDHAGQWASKPNDSPYTAGRAVGLHGSQSSVSSPQGRPYGGVSQYENPHVHESQSTNHSGDSQESPFLPPRPGRVASYPHQQQSRVLENQHTFAILNGRRNEPLHNNRFSTIVETPSNRIDGSQNIRRRDTRNFPLQGPEHSSPDNANEDPFRSSVGGDPSNLRTLGLIAAPPPGSPKSHDDAVALASPTPRNTMPIQLPHPELSVTKGIEWKRGKKLGRKPRLDDEELLEELKGRDHAFLIDNAGSMAAHRSELKKVLGLLAYMVQDCDPDGLDVYFTTCSKSFKFKNIESMMGELETRPPKGLPDMRGRFASIIEKYQERFGKKTLTSFFRGTAPRAPRKLSLFVLTDALWQPVCDLTPTVKTLVTNLIEHKLTNKQIGIQFIRFGNDQKAIQRLQELDSELNLELDIIDTTPADGNVWKMLLGAVNDWFDDD